VDSRATLAWMWPLAGSLGQTKWAAGAWFRFDEVPLTDHTIRQTHGSQPF